MSAPVSNHDCPLMGRLTLLLAETPRSRDAKGRELLLDALADLEAEALANASPADTLAAIRSTRMMVHIPDWPASRPPR
jgi:hypothetical protein